MMPFERAAAMRRIWGGGLLAAVLCASTLAAQDSVEASGGEQVPDSGDAIEQVPTYRNPFDAYRAGAWDQALEGFIDLQVKRPDDPRAVYDIGNTRYRMEEFSSADESYSAAAASGDSSLRAEALYNLGNSAYRQGRLEEAVELYREALGENPDDPDAKFNLEFVREEIRRRQEQQQEQQPQEGGDPGQDSQDQETGDPPQQDPSESPDGGDETRDDAGEEPPPQEPEGEPQGQDEERGDGDQDGISDQTELEGENPTDPTDPDSDDDGLKDGEEDRNANGRVDPGETDPNRPDSDGDGTADGSEQGGAPPDEAPGQAPGQAPAPGELTPEEAERYLQALDDGRPPHGEAEARGVRRGGQGLVMFTAATRAARTLLLVASLVAPLAASAQGVSVTVDRTEASVEEQIVMQVTVEGSRKAEPRLPEMPGFDVLPRGKSSEVQMINGSVTSSVHYTYILLPRASGDFEIGAASAEVDGKVYQSRPFKLRIVEAGAEVQEARDLFVSATVSDRDPFVGQQVIYTWRLYRRVAIGSAQLTPPDYAGFLVEPLGEAREFRQIRNGKEYLVHEVREALFPQEVGKLVIPGRQLTAEVAQSGPRRRGSMMDDFFGRMQTETRVLRTREVEIEVRALPAPPDGFSGLVGEFDVTAKLSQDELAVGESTTLEIVVSGSGNAQMIGEPRIPELPQFKSYDDQPGGALDRSGSQLRGSKSFHRALVAQEAGQFQLDPVSLVYFDPNLEEYRTAASPAMKLSVSPASGEEDLRLTEVVGPTSGKVAVRILADDILPIYKPLNGLEAGLPVTGSTAVTWAGLLLPPFAYLALAWGRRRRLRLHHDVAVRRRRKALRKALDALEEFEVPAASADGQADAADRVSRCLREYLGDKLDLEGAALTAGEADRLLARAGVDDRVVAEMRAMLDRLEVAQYGAGAGVSGVDDLSKGVAGLLKRLEKELS